MDEEQRPKSRHRGGFIKPDSRAKKSTRVRNPLSPPVYLKLAFDPDEWERKIDEARRVEGRMKEWE